MDAAVVDVQHVPVREVIRDRRGAIVGTIERQRLTRRLIARDLRGRIVGSYDLLSETTRDANGRLVGRANLLPALLWQAR